MVPGPGAQTKEPPERRLIASIVDNYEGVEPPVTRRTPVVVVQSRSLHHAEAVQAHFEPTALIRFEDLGTPKEVGRATADADAVVVATQLLDEARIDALGPGVKVIARTGVGVDTVDLDKAAELGISAINQPAYGATEVASHAVGMALAVQRKFMVADQYVRAGWNGTVALSPIKPLDEVGAGVVGCGRIGAVTASLLLHLVREVRVFDPVVASVPDGVVRCSTLDELLAASDILCLHVPLTAHREASSAGEKCSCCPGAPWWSMWPAAASLTKRRSSTFWPRATSEAPASMSSRPSHSPPLRPSSWPPTRSCRRTVRRTRNARPGGSGPGASVTP